MRLSLHPGECLAATQTTAPTTTVMMKIDPPTISARSSEKSTSSGWAVAIATPVKTSGAPLPKARSVTPATSGLSRSSAAMSIASHVPSGRSAAAD
eukprot:scaffold259139_cov40-Tisochrysis_lutea.AAC.2